MADMSFGWLRVVSGMAVGVCMAVGGDALEPGTPLAQYGRQSWSVENGLPQNTIPVLEQTASGYLMAGTEAGLAQFDGVSFRVLDHAAEAAFPDAEIRCLLEVDGQRWIGTSDGLVLVRRGSLRRLTQADGLPSNSIRGLVRGGDGAVWIWTEGGLARWVDGKLAPVSLPAAEHASGITSMAVGGDGLLWVGTTAGLVVWAQGQWAKNSPVSAQAGRAFVAPDGAGGILLCDASGVVLFRHLPEAKQQAIPLLSRAALPVDAITFAVRTSSATFALASRSEVVVVQEKNGVQKTVSFSADGNHLPGSHIQAILADREGTLWVGTNRGLVRISTGGSGPSVTRFAAGDLLARSSVLSLLEDREGDLWVGTETAGLNVLRDARFYAMGSAEGLSSDNATAVMEDAEHALWVGTRDAGLNRISSTQTTVLTTANGLVSDVVLSLAGAPDGSLWVGTPDGLNHLQAGAIRTYTSADGLPDDFVRSLHVDGDGTVWIGSRHGLTRLAGGRFTSWGQGQGLGSDVVGAMVRSADGDLWIATLQGLTRMHGGQFRTFTTKDGLSSDVITALAGDKSGRLWIGTQNNGLNLWDGQRFVALGQSGSRMGGLLPAVVHTLLFDSLGYLWITSENGLTRVEPAFLLRCGVQGVCDLGPESLAVYGTADGLRSRETSSNSHPTAWRTAAGVLWFSSPRGIFSADPRHFPAFAGPPPVNIESFMVDDREQGLFRATPIAAKAQRFEFNYAGISLATPYKVRYEYMLEGFDHGWTDAGMRRTAYYTNIPPGSYTFRVRAAMEDGGSLAFTSPGVVSEATLKFTLEPHYYQTAWFRVLALVLVAGLVLLLVRLRLVRAEREFSAVMAERNRIAREIHDTLAQGYVGISLQLEVLGQLLRRNKADAAAKHLEATQELVRMGLNDARQSIWALRSQDASESTLPVRLKRMVEEARDASLEAELAVHGIFRPLGPEVEQELIRIAQEAMANVKRHAGATRLEVGLDYGQEWVSLTIADNGRGFRLEEPAAGTPARAVGREKGHYGLVGMQERAAVLRAEMTIASEPGSGTTVRLRVRAEADSSRAVS